MTKFSKKLLSRYKPPCSRHWSFFRLELRPCRIAAGSRLASLSKFRPSSTGACSPGRNIRRPKRLFRLWVGRPESPCADVWFGRLRATPRADSFSSKRGCKRERRRRRKWRCTRNSRRLRFRRRGWSARRCRDKLARRLDSIPSVHQRNWNKGSKRVFANNGNILKNRMAKLSENEKIFKKWQSN